MPYMIVGVLLWLCVHASGLHATLAGALLAFFIPTRPPPDLGALMTQATSIMDAEAEAGGGAMLRRPSLPALRALDAIHDRLESPTAHTLRYLTPRSSYIVLPLFALANAGVTLSAASLQGRGRLVAAIALGLIIGKPLGLTLASWLVVRLGWAVKPAEYSWRQLLGAGALAGIGFTMALLIAGEAFDDPQDFAVAKVAVFAASLLSALVGVLLLWRSSRETAAAPAAQHPLPEPRLETQGAPGARDAGGRLHARDAHSLEGALSAAGRSNTNRPGARPTRAS
jgi:NhaA family Na+:H+ antiporter